MNKKKAGIIVLQILTVLILLTITVNAWFALQKRTVNTEGLEVDIPPIIFVRDNTAIEDSYVLNYENLVIGQPSYIVFCVVPREENIVSKYDLQLAFTTNMNATINLYKVTEVYNDDGVMPANAIHYGDYYYSYGTVMGFTTPNTISEEFSSNGQEYQRYINQEFDREGDGLSLPEWVNIPQNEARFYVLEITWADGAAAGIDPKETDIIYVYVKATEMVSDTTTTATP